MGKKPAMGLVGLCVIGFGLSGCQGGSNYRCWGGSGSGSHTPAVVGNPQGQSWYTQPRGAVAGLPNNTAPAARAATWPNGGTTTVTSVPQPNGTAAPVQTMRPADEAPRGVPASYQAPPAEVKAVDPVPEAVSPPANPKGELLPNISSAVPAATPVGKGMESSAASAVPPMPPPPPVTALKPDTAVELPPPAPPVAVPAVMPPPPAASGPPPVPPPTSAPVPELQPPPGS